MRIKAVLIGIGLCIVSLTAVVHAQAPAPIKIGFLAEMAGLYGAPGRDQYDGFMLAVQERGGKLGGIPINLIKEDTQFKPDVASQIVDRLIERDKVELFTGVTYSHM